MACQCAAVVYPGCQAGATQAPEVHVEVDGHGRARASGSIPKRGGVAIETKAEPNFQFCQPHLGELQYFTNLK